MKLFSRAPVVTLFAATFATCAFAEDPMDALKAATKAQNDAPAYRMKIVSTDPTTKVVNTITMENVNPDKMHMKMENGATTMMEVVSDGQKTYMAQGGGKMQEAPAGMGEMIAQSRKQNALDAMTKSAQDVKFVGHENVGGTATSVYTFSADMSGIHSTSKVWVSDKDHRPLKMEGEAKGDAGGRAIDQELKISFDYDPSIKVVLPTP